MFSKKEDGEGESPKGFEKFIKKVRDKPKPETEKKETAKKAEESEETELSEAEEATEGRKTSKKDQKSKSKDENKDEKSTNEGGNSPFGNGGPSMQNVLLATMLGISTIYFFQQFAQSTRKEVTYMEFVSEYLSKGRVQMITVSEDATNETFKYKVEIECTDQSKVYLILP